MYVRKVKVIIIRVDRQKSGIVKKCPWKNKIIQISKENKAYFLVLFIRVASINEPPLGSAICKIRMPPNYFTKLQIASINQTHVHYLSMYDLKRSLYRLYLIQHLGNYFYGKCHIGVVQWFLDNMINLLQVRLQLFGWVHQMIIQ